MRLRHFLLGKFTAPVVSSVDSDLRKYLDSEILALYPRESLEFFRSLHSRLAPIVRALEAPRAAGQRDVFQGAVLRLVIPRDIGEWLYIRIFPNTPLDHMNREVMLKIYDQEEDPTGYEPKSIALRSAVQIKLDKQVTITNMSAVLSAKRFRLRRLRSDGPAEATVKYRWAEGSKTFKTHLCAGKLSKLDDDTHKNMSLVATLEEIPVRTPKI